MRALAASLLLLASAASADDAGRAERRAAYKQWDAGVALVLAGEEGKAKEAWAACLRLDPENADCRAGLKLLGETPDLSAKAPPPPNPREIPEPVHAAETQIEPKRKAVKHWNAGIIYFQQGDYPKALAEWRLCAAQDEMNKDCRTGIDRVEGRLALPKPSRPAPGVNAKDSATTGIQKAFVHWNAGLLHYQKGELEKARREWAMCRTSDPTNMDCHTGLLRITRQYGGN